MYNRVGRGLLLVVGRQLRQKLCENTTSFAATSCVASAAINNAPCNYVLHRNYCDKKTCDESVVAPPELVSPDDEATIKLDELLTKPEHQRMQKIIELEIEVMRQNSERVPENLKPRHWFELLNLNSRSKRKRYLQFVFGLEKKRENLLKLKAEKLRKYQEEVEDPTKETSMYRIGGNTMFLRIYDSTINQLWNNRLMQRMMFGQQIVLDCGYEKHMTQRELKNCAKQLQLTFATNRIHDDPFDLYLCNADIQGELMKHFHRFIPPLYNTDFPINVKTESYLDVFDKERLVYLTPHAQFEMKEFDHDAIYIIGAFVDKATNEPVSLAKAKKEGLKMYKFPLDRHLQWGASSGKNLTINQVMSVLLDLRLTGSWEEALKHVPRRKLYEARNSQMERKLGRFNFTEFSGNENYSSPVQELKLKDKFTHKSDQSYRPKFTKEFTREQPKFAKQDFSMEARKKTMNKWKN